MTGLAFSRHLIERQLNAEVTAGHHDAVEREDDGLEVADRLRLLHLGDDRQELLLVGHDVVHELDVVGRADEGQRDQVDAQLQGEAKVGLVLVAHGRHADRDVG
jgi:hypothetical protein